MNAGIVILVAVLCFLLGALLVWLFLRRRLAAAETRYAELMASHQKKEKEAAECAARADRLERARAEAAGRLVDCDQKVGALEAEGREHLGRIQSLEAELGAARSETAAREQELAARRAELDQARGDWSAQLAERDQRLSLLEAGRAAPVMGVASLEEPGTAAAEPDDLAVVEGIGPKISRLLQDSGIRTFRQLAESPVERLQQILDQARLRLADPGTWPEQARLAAAGDWEALSALQGRLKGGR